MATKEIETKNYLKISTPIFVWKGLSNMFDENTIVEKIQLAELDKDKKYIIFIKYVNRPSNEILVRNVRQLQNLLKDLNINNVIIVPEVKNEIEYSIVESE